MWKSQRGYFLLEAMIVPGIIVVMAATVAIFEKAMVIRQVEGARAEAIYLANEQLANLAWQADYQKGLPQGEINWLGNASDLEQKSGRYEVIATVKKIEAEEYFAISTTHWQTGNHEGEVQLERRIIVHAQKGAT